jgi:hypothetical protein
VTPLDRRPPLVLWLYLAATALGYGLSYAPSSVHTSYAASGVLIWAALLIALLFRSIVARRILIVLGVLAAIAGQLVQGGSWDQVAAVLSAVELVKVGLLLTPAMRRYTSRSSLGSEAAA